MAAARPGDARSRVGLGIFLGFWVGLLPGLGGSTTLALMPPFIRLAGREGRILTLVLTLLS